MLRWYQAKGNLYFGIFGAFASTWWELRNDQNSAGECCEGGGLLGEANVKCRRLVVAPILYTDQQRQQKEDEKRNVSGRLKIGGRLSTSTRIAQAVSRGRIEAYRALPKFPILAISVSRGLQLHIQS